MARLSCEIELEGVAEPDFILELSPATAARVREIHLEDAALHVLGVAEPDFISKLSPATAARVRKGIESLEERERKGGRPVDHFAEFVLEWNSRPWRVRKLPVPRRLRRLLASARPVDAGPHVRPRARAGHRRRCTRGPPSSDPSRLRKRFVGRAAGRRS